MALLQQTDILTDAQRIRRNIKRGAIDAVEKAILRYESGLVFFWKHPNFTPQEIANFLAEDGAEFINFYTELRKFILAVKPGTQLTPVSQYGTFTVEQNGHITVTSVV